MAAAADDRFVTVAITWSQPEAGVMLAMFAFYGIPAFAVGRHHASVSPTYLTVLQGIQIRVAIDGLDEALALLAEVADRPAAVRPYPLRSALFYRVFVATALAAPFVAALVDPVLAWLAATPVGLCLAAAPPPRTASTFVRYRHRPAAS